MPSLDKHPSTTCIKMLVAADSGNGKTGGLASLVDAGFNVRVLDFDCGVSTLAGRVKKRENLANVAYLELRDELTLVGGRMSIKKAAAFQRAMDALDKGGTQWGEDQAHIPPVSQWTARDVLVLDTLGMAGRASLQMVMQANGAAMKSPELQHYGTAMENIEKLLAQLTSPSVPCHLIVNTHLVGMEGTAKLYPDALGSKLGPKIGRYFDNMLTVSVTAGARTYKTVKDGMFACKTAKAISETYPIETGMLSIFEALTGKKAAEILES